MKKLMFCFSLLLITPFFSGSLYSQETPTSYEKQDQQAAKEKARQLKREALRAERESLKKQVEMEREEAIKLRLYPDADTTTLKVDSAAAATKDSLDDN